MSRLHSPTIRHLKGGERSSSETFGNKVDISLKNDGILFMESMNYEQVLLFSNVICLLLVSTPDFDRYKGSRLLKKRQPNLPVDLGW